MNIPNALTLSRIVLAIIIVMLLEENSLSGDISAVIVFAAASLTDFYDGHLAKKWGLVSDFGKIMDPIADKILLLSIFGVLAHIGMIAWWMFIVIAIREMVVTIFRFWAMSQGEILAAERAGKIKTVVQIIAVSSILLYLVANQCANWFLGVSPAWSMINYGLMLAAVVLTVYSGVDYFRNMRDFVIKMIATCLGVGYLPAAPGTWATVVGVAIAYFLSNDLPAYSIVMIVLLILGIMTTGIMAHKMNQKDPGCLCIDEVVGVMIALWGLPLTWSVMICGFFLFRAFDMFKIYPVNKLEAQPGGWGIMLDDCMAAVYTNIILRIALRCAGFF